ncbi:class I SAM-dependent methyltransferase [Actinoplanes sp. RD1]|uniref:class I SAM-dependent methyltransferase n=1 Tax=Actinoplanes sp. RD1 TaxID=3064538 RepID=UPI0027411884|nr:methyltransferase domain-containing protein [Actinoplanes sp. RD1]
MTETTYIPAMGRHWMLFLYDPVTRLAGLPRVHDQLLDRAAVRPGHQVLEIGCGPGDLLLRLARRTPDAPATGIDPDPAALRRARRKAGRAGLTVRFEHAYAAGLPLPDGSVDRVLSSYMFHHLDAAGKVAALREVARVLRPGGELHLVDADGTGRTSPLLAGNVPARVLAAMRDAGLSDPAETGRGRRAGPLGSYVFYQACRAGA